jgi:hypothetical protein
MSAHDASKPTDRFEQFLQACAEEFLTLPVTREPEFKCVGGSTTTSIHVFDVAPATMAFFEAIMVHEPDRFKALNRGFHEAQPDLQGVGWVITRFAGAVFLSLSLGDEIYVRRVPVPLSPQAVALAKNAGRFLDSSVADHPRDERSSSMPQSLAQSLLDRIA